MDDLVAFLLARLDGIEWDARAAKEVASKRTHYRAAVTTRADRDLADVEAKRRLVDEYVTLAEKMRRSHGSYRAWVEGRPDDPYPGANCSNDDPGQLIGLLLSMRLLALPYADHPDYDERWRP